MCGIIGCTGSANSTEMVVNGLRQLEYRGYDSWGIALQKPELMVVKRKGKISDADIVIPESTVAIGHSRWATHGAVTEKNAHPHTSCDGRIAVVHNGIIENHQELKKKLKGHTFRSETDTEVIPHMIEERLQEGFVNAVIGTARALEGRYAFITLIENDPRIVAARKGSPLVIGVGEDEYYIASDVPAFLDKTDKVVFMEDNQVAVLNYELRLYDMITGEEVKPIINRIDWTPEQAEKDGYEHFMLKEMLEQGHTVDAALNQDRKTLAAAKKSVDSATNIYLVGAGTAGKVCLLGEYLFSRLLRRKATYIPAGEFINHADTVTGNDLMIVVSQSGETADALEAIEVAKKKGAKVLSIVNVQGSSITRCSDLNFLIHAGPERAVCSTKATTAQMAVMELICHTCIGEEDEGRALLKHAQSLLKHFIEDEDNRKGIRTIAEKIVHQDHIYLIGRGLHYPIALEAAIKIQEISYIHAQAFSGSELKHGPIALITEGSVCVAFVPEDETKKDMLSNVQELKARGAKILAIGSEDNELYDEFIKVPEAGIANPLISLVPAQLLAYELALLRGNDPDYPRNLAKSVTVK